VIDRPSPSLDRITLWSAIFFAIFLRLPPNKFLRIPPDLSPVSIRLALLFLPWYWDQNDANRAFAKEYFAAQGRMPSYTVVGVYSAVIHYLRAVEALGSHADGKAVVEKMKELPIWEAWNAPFFIAQVS
jgi:hypothetical protein